MSRPRLTLSALPILLVLLFGSGCATARIFHADFNADAVGARPNTSPPTAPAGDQIYMSDSSAPVSGQFEVVDNPALGSRALQYANVNVDLSRRFLGFISATVSPAATNEVWAVWDGIPNLPANASPLDIWLGNNHFQASARLRLDNGNVSVQTPGGGQNFENVGTYTNGRIHAVILRVNRADQTYSLSFLERNSPAINVGPRPFLAAFALDASNPTLWMQFSAETSSPGTYVIDNVMIRR